MLGQSSLHFHWNLKCFKNWTKRPFVGVCQPPVTFFSLSKVGETFLSKVLKYSKLLRRLPHQRFCSSHAMKDFEFETKLCLLSGFNCDSSSILIFNDAYDTKRIHCIRNFMRFRNWAFLSEKLLTNNYNGWELTSIMFLAAKIHWPPVCNI